MQGLVGQATGAGSDRRISAPKKSWGWLTDEVGPGANRVDAPSWDESAHPAAPLSAATCAVDRKLCVPASRRVCLCQIQKIGARAVTSSL